VDREIAGHRESILAGPLHIFRPETQVWDLFHVEKAALLRWTSRCASRVLIVDASIVASTREPAMSLSSRVSMPVMPVNWPSR